MPIHLMAGNIQISQTICPCKTKTSINVNRLDQLSEKNTDKKDTANYTL